MVNLTKSELEPKQTFDFVGYQYNLLQSGQAHPKQVTATETCLSDVKTNMSCETIHGFLTAIKKQVPLERKIPVPRSLNPHLQWWTQEANILPGQPLCPLQHALQVFMGTLNEDLGAGLGDNTVRGTRSVPKSKLHINFLELKAILPALKWFKLLVQGKTVLIATDNTTVVAYKNK